MQKVMCKWLALGLVAASSFFCDAANNDPVLARYHFIGTSHLTAKNYDQLHKILNQQTAVEYREFVLNRFAREIANGLSANSIDSAAGVRPLLDDLIANESVGVFGEAPSFVIAVHLPKTRVNAWMQAVPKLSNALHAQQRAEWVLVARGDSLKAAEDKMVSDIERTGRPGSALKDALLEANIDWPRLSNIPAIAAFPLKPAVLDVKVSPKGEHLRTEIHAHYPQAIPWKSQPWKLPTETIRDPLVSFTAGQDAAAFMKQSVLAERIGENPFTNQFFIWANLSIPFETSALFPIKNAQRHLQSLGRELPSKFNSELEKNYEGKLTWVEKTNQLVWHGLPILVPYVKSIHEKAGEFLLAGTFVLAPGGPAAPADLWAQFKGRSDLVYYDWEFTGPRLAQWRMVTPLLPMFPMRRTNDVAWNQSKHASAMHTPIAIVDHWLSGLIPLLSPTKQNQGNGNVITQVTRNSAYDYTVVRSSQLGFTGIELTMLSHWLANTPPPEVPRDAAQIPLPPGGKRLGK
jgi:hypothetical protein